MSGIEGTEREGEHERVLGGVNFGRVAAVWLVLVAVESVNGTVRTLWIAPRVGDFRARQIGAFTASLLIVAIACWFSNWMRLRGVREQLQAGLLWVALMLGFELLFGHYVFGMTWAKLAQDYDLLHGGLLPLGFVVLMLAPWIGARVRA